MIPRLLRIVAWCVSPLTTMCNVMALVGIGARWNWVVAVLVVAPLLVVSAIGSYELARALREEADWRTPARDLQRREPKT